MDLILYGMVLGWKSLLVGGLVIILRNRIVEISSLELLIKNSNKYSFILLLIIAKIRQYQSTRQS